MFMLKPRKGWHTMKAIVVYPGQPNSMHLEEIPMPKVTDIPGWLKKLLTTRRQTRISSRVRGQSPTLGPGAERLRLAEAHEQAKPWYRWEPYLSDRQWGTVREDYSPYGTAWDSFSHDHARFRTYRWGEDGLLGISDEDGLLCCALALWNGADPILKERLFGLTGSEGNHGEDVKEYYYFLDSTPTHSYMKALYKYPQRAFP